MKQRELRIVRHGWGITGRCSACKQVFVPSPELRRDPEAQERQMHDYFKHHNCDENNTEEAAPTIPGPDIQ